MMIIRYGPVRGISLFADEEADVLTDLCIRLDSLEPSTHNQVIRFLRYVGKTYTAQEISFIVWVEGATSVQ